MLSNSMVFVSCTQLEPAQQLRTTPAAQAAESQQPAVSIADPPSATQAAAEQQLKQLLETTHPETLDNALGTPLATAGDG
jgi:hypothetical protein